MAADSSPFWLNIDKKNRTCILHLAECDEVKTKDHPDFKAQFKATAPDLQSILERPEAYRGREWPNRDGGWLAVSSRQQAKQEFAALVAFRASKDLLPCEYIDCSKCH